MDRNVYRAIKRVSSTLSTHVHNSDKYFSLITFAFELFYSQWVFLGGYKLGAVDIWSNRRGSLSLLFERWYHS